MENTTQTPQITVSDLDSIRAIIDVAAQRGAFKAGELTQVGAVFDKLNAFLQSVVEQAQAAEAAATEETGNAETQGE